MKVSIKVVSKKLASYVTYRCATLHMSHITSLHMVCVGGRGSHSYLWP